MLCPRRCGADRLSGETGACGETAELRAARAALHFWEEPCLTGPDDPAGASRKGCGAVFFTGCALRCAYCQNGSISRGKAGAPLTAERLTEIFFELAGQGASCIDLVTPDHFLPHVVAAVRAAKERGLSLPVVWNCSGYADPAVLRLLDGIVDIYLTDLKYLDPALAGEFSAAPDYPAWAKDALSEMVRQRGAPVRDDTGKLVSGVIVRHLVLPGHVMPSCGVLRYLAETYGNQVIVSILRQYTPPSAPETDARSAKVLRAHPELLRPLTAREYDRAVRAALDYGLENAYLQEAGTEKESFIPAFDGTGIM